MAGGIPHQPIDFSGIVNTFFAARNAAEQRGQRDWEMARIERQDRLAEADAARKAELAQLMPQAIEAAQGGDISQLMQINPELGLKFEERHRAVQAAERDQAMKRSELTNAVRRRMASALERNPGLASNLQSTVQQMADSGQIDWFQLPGQALPEGIAGPQMAPTKQEIGDLRASSMFAAPAKPGAATDLRKEFQGSPEFKAAREVRTAFRKVQTASGNAAGDQALVFGYMKLLDPGSTVRDSERADATNAQGVPSWVRTQWNKVFTGETLSPEQRKMFKREAGKTYAAQRKGIEEGANEYRRLAEQEGFDPADVVLDLWGDGAQDAEESPAEAAPAPAQKPKKPKQPNAQRITRTDPTTGETRYWNGSAWVAE